MSPYDLLTTWYKAQQALAKAKKEEADLRKQVFESYFPEPDYGTNKCDIPGDAELVATYPLNLSIDESALETALESVPKTKRDNVVNYKPSLDKRVYNSLSRKAKDGFDECVIAKPGTPSMVIRMKPEED